jgi:hypothetical protein
MAQSPPLFVAPWTKYGSLHYGGKSAASGRDDVFLRYSILETALTFFVSSQLGTNLHRDALDGVVSRKHGSLLPSD